MKHFILPAMSVIILLYMIGCKSNDRLEPITADPTFEPPNPNGPNLTEPKNVQTSGIYQFIPLSDFGGKIDEQPSTDVYPPGSEAFATLKRSPDFLQLNIHANVLPNGAYVVYWLIFNEPVTCMDSHPLGNSCGGHGEEDLALPSASIVWATGKVIETYGAGKFQARLYKDEKGFDPIYLGGDLKAPLEKPFAAEVHVLIKHQGEASADPDTLFAQTHSLFGRSYLQLKAVFPSLGN